MSQDTADQPPYNPGDPVPESPDQARQIKAKMAEWDKTRKGIANQKAIELKAKDALQKLAEGLDVAVDGLLDYIEVLMTGRAQQIDALQQAETQVSKLFEAANNTLRKPSRGPTPRQSGTTTNG